MVKLFNCLLLLCILCFNVKAREVTIEGLQKSYAGKTIEWKTFADPFTGRDTVIHVCRIDSNGFFKFSFPCNNPMLIYSFLGIFKGYLHVEPNKNYIISLPEWKDKNPADKLNPYFQPIEIQINIENDSSKNSLNLLILRFDTIFFKILQEANQYLKKRQKINIDSLKNYLLYSIPYKNNPFLNDYVTYKLGLLELMLQQYKVKSLSRKYFEFKPILYNNVAYFDLFNRVYDKYFYFFGQSFYGKNIFDIINVQKSYFKLNELFSKDPVLQNENLRELVILKNIHDEFYESRFSRSGLLSILDSIIVNTKIPEHKKYAVNIRYKITRLMPGFFPPAFELYDLYNRLVKLSDFYGNYVYLNFCSCNSYACIKEFDLLRNLAQKYTRKNFIIVTIVTDEEIMAMQPYATNTPMNWYFLHYGNQPNVLKDYDIRGYPQYYLIGPDGKLILSPAKSPGEYFELELFNIMRARGHM